MYCLSEYQAALSPSCSWKFSAVEFQTALR